MDKKFELYKDGQLDVTGMNKEFGRRLKARYQDLNRLPERHGVTKLTQQGIAELLNVEPETVKSWCGGKAFPKIAKLIELSALLDCDPGFLLCTQECPRQEYADVARVTGLSEASVERLKRWNTVAFRFVAKTIDTLLAYRDAVQQVDDPLYAIYSFLRQSNKAVYVASTTGRASDTPGMYMQEYQSDDIQTLRIGHLLRDVKRSITEPEV